MSTRPRRHLDIFPPGFDSKSSISRGHYHFSAEQLYNRLTGEYQPESHVESTLVKTVWYGKQTKSAQHEFILIEVEDTVARLRNYLVLDRNLDETLSYNGGGDQAPCGDARNGLMTSSRSCRSVALDAFRVSYDGVEQQLLRECLLLPRQYLEKIEFHSEEPLYLYQLVTLAYVISEKSPNYVMASRNCYWFAGLIWECMRSLRPKATYDGRLCKKRGKFSILRYTPEAQDRDQMCDAFDMQMQEVEGRLSHSRKIWRAMSRLNEYLQSEGTDVLREPVPEPKISYGLMTIEENPSSAGSRESMERRVSDRPPSLNRGISPTESQGNSARGRGSWYKW